MTTRHASKPLSSVLGQPTAIQTLRRSLSEDRISHAYLFEGPDGVGKEKTAFALAQALLCEVRNRPAANKAERDDACGDCSACRRVLLRPGEARPSHPDIIVLERGLYEPASIGRRTPETQDLSVDQIRTLVLARAAFPPHEGIATVFIVRRAEELSQSAANALLKTLEEPGSSTYFILMSAVPGSLLPTIQSRTQRIRFGVLPEPIVAQLLEQTGTPRDQATGLAKLSSGSMARAARLADSDAAAVREQFVSKALKAITHPHPALAFEIAEEAKKHKDDLPEHLGALAVALADQGRLSAINHVENAAADASRFRLVLLAMRHLRGNASAQLAVEAMFLRMRRI